VEPMRCISCGCCSPITSTPTTTTGSLLPAPTGRRTRRTWRPGTQDKCRTRVNPSSDGEAKQAARPRLQLRGSQHACGVVEQLTNRHAARYRRLRVAEVDDDLQDRPAGLDTETIGIELPAVGQAGGPLACVQLPENVLHRIGPGARQLLPDYDHVIDRH